MKYVPWAFPKFCRSLEHNPPMHLVRKPGVHEHRCPLCGKLQVVEVDQEYSLKSMAQLLIHSPEAGAGIWRHQYQTLQIENHKPSWACP